MSKPPIVFLSSALEARLRLGEELQVTCPICAEACSLRWAPDSNKLSLLDFIHPDEKAGFGYDGSCWAGGHYLHVANSRVKLFERVLVLEEDAVF